MDTAKLAVLEEKIDVIGSDVCKISKLLQGNGTPEKGIIVRLDRIEQAEKRRNWLIKAALGAAITALVATGAKLIGL